MSLGKRKYQTKCLISMKILAKLASSVIKTADVYITPPAGGFSKEQW